MNSKERVSDFFRTARDTMRTNGVLFFPGIFLVGAGLAALLAPGFFIALVSAFFLFFGGLFVFLAWKFVEAKRKFDHLAKQFSGGKFIIQGVSLQRPFDFGPEPREKAEAKKVIIH